MKKINELTKLSFGRVSMLLKWLVFAGTAGTVIGVVGAAFAKSISYVTELRLQHPWLLYLLPFLGLAIAFIYHFEKESGGTNLVLEAVKTGKRLPFRMAPMIFISTVLTHLGGGSAGREGAALQIGGSIAVRIGEFFKISEEKKRGMIMCGMAAGFAALFGTPLAATVFAIEVITVGVIHYSALVPCSIAALAAYDVAQELGVHAERFVVSGIPEFGFMNGIKIGLLAFLCAGLSIIFCKTLHLSEKFYEKRFPNPYVRIFAGGVVVIVLAKILGTVEYLGGGMDIVGMAVAGKTAAAAFLLKMIFTGATLGAGYKGGEIVPTLFVGATFGCLFGQLIGFSPSLCAACGMIAMFSAVTNSPLASLVLGFEMFGFEGMPFYLLAVAISYMESGYYGLYHGQIIVFSKTAQEAVHEDVKH